MQILIKKTHSSSENTTHFYPKILKFHSYYNHFLKKKTSQKINF